MAMSAEEARRLNEYYAETNAKLKQQAEIQKSLQNFDEQRRLTAEQFANNQRAINALEEEYLTGNKKVKGELDKINAAQQELRENERKTNTELQTGIKRRQRSVDLAKELGKQLKSGWKYLQDQDKIIKSTNLNLGMSGTKAMEMRDSFEKSAGYVARLGGDLSDIAGVMQGFAEETGRARVMSAEMVKDITNIGKGTGLGVEQATRLGAQFEIMGIDAKSTMDYVQGVVDTSERMGVNTTKVLKVVNDNFKKLNTYTFQQGVKGFGQMAMYAEKFKIDINDALNAADVARSLEGAIDLAAQLQVMGGQFAKTDPFEMLFLSRNDPAKFTEKIADMTKGVVSFRKMADGTFEKFISPADRDRLAAVAKSMGMEASALTEIAQRQAEIQKMRNQMAGMGLSKEQKEAIEGAAVFDTKTGKFQVKLGTTMKEITKLTQGQAESFLQEQVLLSERAKTAMTFDETFKATINSLKTALLPLLTSVNKVLTWVTPAVDKLGEISGKGGGIWKAAGLLAAGAIAWKGVAFALNKGASNWIATGNALKGTGGKNTTSVGNFLSGNKTRAPKVGGTIAKGAGGSALGAGLGAGAAMAGTGAGIMLAAKGISQLADSMAKLTPEQAESLQKIAVTMAVTFPLSAIGILLAGKAAQSGALGFLALGAAFVGIGFGIKLATEGIGKMSTGLAKLNDSGGGAGKELLGVAAGVGAITLAMGAGGIVGLAAFNNGLKRLNRNSEGVEKIGAAFAKINTVLSGSKDDFLAVERAITSIGNTNISGGGMFADLKNLLNKPLKVEFANNSRLTVANDITLQIDGNKFMRKVYNPEIAIQMQESLRNGRGTTA